MSNVWEVLNVGNLVEKNCNCSGEAGVGGSTNAAVQSQFQLPDYSRNTSFGKYIGTFTGPVVSLYTCLLDVTNITKLGLLAVGKHQGL